jgi:hypothetical protein
MTPVEQLKDIHAKGYIADETLMRFLASMQVEMTAELMKYVMNIQGLDQLDIDIAEMEEIVKQNEDKEDSLAKSMDIEKKKDLEVERRKKQNEQKAIGYKIPHYTNTIDLFNSLLNQGNDTNTQE